MTRLTIRSTAGGAAVGTLAMVVCALTAIWVSGHFQMFSENRGRLQLLIAIPVTSLIGAGALAYGRVLTRAQMLWATLPAGLLILGGIGVFAGYAAWAWALVIGAVVFVPWIAGMLIGTSLGRAGSSTHVLIALLAVLGGCASDSDERAREAAEAWSVSSEPLTAIGQLEGDPRYLFQQIAGVRLLPDGRVVVADRGFGAVRVYGPDGSFQQGMGRPGQGPGEFDHISSISLFPPDTIAVYDSGLYRLMTYAPDGTLLSTLSIRGEGGRPERFVGRFANGDLVLAWIVQTQREPMRFAADVMQFGRFSPEGVLKTLLATATGMVRHQEGIMGMIPFSPRLHSFLHRDSIYFTDGLGHIAVAGGNGAVARTIEVPIDPVDYGEARAQLAVRLEAAEVDLRLADPYLERPDLLQELNEAPVPDLVPRVAEVLLDDEGRFWLKRYDPASDSQVVSSFDRRAGGEWWVLQPDGRVAAVIQLPDGFTPMDVRGERIVGVASDELDVERVLVFGIVRGD